jgi:hypothetical protein
MSVVQSISKSYPTIFDNLYIEDTSLGWWITILSLFPFILDLLSHSTPRERSLITRLKS